MKLGLENDQIYENKKRYVCSDAIPFNENKWKKTPNRVNGNANCAISYIDWVELYFHVDAKMWMKIKGDKGISIFQIDQPRKYSIFSIQKRFYYIQTSEKKFEIGKSQNRTFNIACLEQPNTIKFASDFIDRFEQHPV